MNYEAYTFPTKVTVHTHKILSLVNLNWIAKQKTHNQCTLERQDMNLIEIMNNSLIHVYSRAKVVCRENVTSGTTVGGKRLMDLVSCQNCVVYESLMLTCNCPQCPTCHKCLRCHQCGVTRPRSLALQFSCFSMPQCHELLSNGIYTFFHTQNTPKNC